MASFCHAYIKHLFQEADGMFIEAITKHTPVWLSKLKQVRRVAFGHTFFTEAEQTWILCELTWEKLRHQRSHDPNSCLFSSCCSVCSALHPSRPGYALLKYTERCSCPLNVSQVVFLSVLRKKKKRKWKCGLYAETWMAPEIYLKKLKLSRWS